jgi:glutamyl-tRNA synthetase
MSVRVRFAPSPTGSPHVGNLRTAIFNSLFAQKMGGQFIGRLEDTDRTPERYKPEAIAEIENSLRLLDILPDEWWVSGGPVAPYVQSERLPIYQKYADELVEMGKAYYCYTTKEELDEMRARQQAMGLPTGYDRRHRYLTSEDRARLEAEGRPRVVRLAMPLDGQTVVNDVVRGKIVFENRTQDDQVLLKSDGFPTYFLACAVDDHLMGITHIIRGDDWLSSAPKLVAVFEALGWEPPLFAHAPLIVGQDKKKLSKRHGSTEFMEFIRQGYLPEALVNFLVLLGWSAGEENRELFTREELVERFSLEGMTEHPAVFDYDKLKWMNGHYIRQMSDERLAEVCLPYLVNAGLVSDPPTAEQREKLDRVLPLEKERLKLLSEVPELVGFFFHELDFPTGYEEKAIAKWLTGENVKPLLGKEIAAFEALSEWTAEALDTTVHAVAEEMGLTLGQAVHPTRVAATGRTVGPGLFETLWALGRDTVLTRLKAVRERI